MSSENLPKEIFFDFSNSLSQPTVYYNSRRNVPIMSQAYVENTWYNQDFSGREANWKEALLVKVFTEFGCLPMAIIIMQNFLNTPQFKPLKAYQPIPDHIVPISVLRLPPKEEIEQTYFEHHPKKIPQYPKVLY